MIDTRLTPSELERAVHALIRVRALRHEPWDTNNLRRFVGLGTRPLGSTLRQLAALGLIVIDDQGRWDLTGVGEHILDAVSDRNWRPLTALVLSAGELEQEMLAFVSAAATSENHAVIHGERAKTICPTLAAVLRWVPEWRDGKQLVVPLEVLQAAMGSVVMDIVDGHRDWVADRERVGHRAEAYSLTRERECRGLAAVLHVSRDLGDHAGYDLEDVSAAPSRLIECKGSRSSALRFVITAHELEIARAHSQRYEIQFWGEIDLARPPETEYAELLEAGYPQVLEDPASRLAEGALISECAAWEITRGIETP